MTVSSIPTAIPHRARRELTVNESITLEVDDRSRRRPAARAACAGGLADVSATAIPSPGSGARTRRGATAHRQPGAALPPGLTLPDSYRSQKQAALPRRHDELRWPSARRAHHRRDRMPSRVQRREIRKTQESAQSFVARRRAAFAHRAMRRTRKSGGVVLPESGGQPSRLPGMLAVRAIAVGGRVRSD